MNLENMLGALFLLGAAVLRAGEPPPPVFRVTADDECLTAESCDSVRVVVTATNVSAAPFTGWVATVLEWSYAPSESVRAFHRAGIDSLEKVGKHVCRWAPVHLLIGDEHSNGPFPGRELSLAPGGVFRDTLVRRTGVRDPVDFPGVLEATVSLWAGTPGAPWREAHCLGRCRFDIRVPR